MDKQMCFVPATELRELIRSKQVSVSELVELFYSRIQELNPKLNAYLALCTDQAMAEAAQEAVQRGASLGPLHGIPISVKDLELTKGIPSTMGSLLFKDRTPDIDSVVVERIRQAGAIILGKTNTPEFGQSGTTENKLGDACRNPWNLERTPGAPAAARLQPWPRGCVPWRRGPTEGARFASRPASAASLESNRPRGECPCMAAMADRRPTNSLSRDPCPGLWRTRPFCWRCLRVLTPGTRRQCARHPQSSRAT